MNPEQLEQLIEKMLCENGAALRLFAMTWSCEPDDCLQQALIKLASANPQPDNAVAWLYRVVRNEAISRSRSEKRRRTREQQVATQRQSFQSGFQNSFDSDEVTAALAELKTEQREVVIARVWGGLTFDEIGATVGCSSSAADRRFRAGLKQMKSILCKQSKQRTEIK